MARSDSSATFPHSLSPPEATNSESVVWGLHNVILHMMEFGMGDATCNNAYLNYHCDSTHHQIFDTARQSLLTPYWRRQVGLLDISPYHLEGHREAQDGESKPLRAGRVLVRASDIMVTQLRRQPMYGSESTAGPKPVMEMGECFLRAFVRRMLQKGSH